MHLQKMTLTALLTLVATLTISDFPLIENLIPLSKEGKIQNSQVLAQTADARKAEADRLLQQGIQQYRTSQFEAALQTWQKALTIYREIKDHKHEEIALGSLGMAYRSLKDYAKAIEYSQQWLALTREIKDRQGEGAALSNLGLVYHSLGDYAKAIEYTQQWLAIAKAIKDRQSEGAALSNLGIAYHSLGDYAKAIEYTQQWLAITREINNRQSEGAALYNLGLAYNSLRDYAKAIEYSQQLLALTREINDREVEGKALANLGIAYLYLHDYGKATDYLQQQLALAKAIKDRQSEGKALGNLGIAYLFQGDYAKAIDYLQQQLAITREIKDRQGEGQALGNLGLAYINLGDSAKAIDYLQQDLAIAREIKDRQGEGQALGNLGIAYLNLGDYAKVIEYSQHRLAIAREIKDRQGEGKVLGSLGQAYLFLGDYAKAIDYTQQDLAIAKAIKDRDSEGRVLNNLGLTLYKEGNLATAEQTLIEGIKVLESIRADLGSNDANKVSIFERQANTYNHLQKVLIAQNKTDAALEIAERGRARAFVELLARRLSPNPTEQPPITPPTIELIKQIAKAQKATLVQYSIIYDDFKVQGKPRIHESELYIWVIKPTGEVTFRRSDLKPLWQQQNTSLDELVASSREAIGVSRSIFSAQVVNPVDEHNQTKRLQQLHQLLIEPIADLLSTNPSVSEAGRGSVPRVVFIPQSSLFLAPFPALQDKEGKYLIEKHTILTAPSIQVLELTRQQRERVGARMPKPLQDALVVGNPTMPSVPPVPGEKPQKLPSLPGAEQEAKAIAPLLNTKPIIGKDATKSAIEQMMPKARIIHLATHGLLDDVRGLGSALALAPSGNDDGLLQAEDILDMKLNAELVVLSACDTGRGRITGDGVIGLSHSLITAGVPSVLVSLWSVPDAPTASLMTNFYQNFQNNPDKAQALRQAMLTTMKQHPNPRNWAAFTLIGEAE